jgi:hypothetical protein
VADSYIDNHEISEYGRYFLAMVVKLIGLSALVDIQALYRLVLAEVEAMEAALARASVQKSGVRTGRSSTSDASAELADWLRRFYYDLKTLPPGTVLDRAAFFPTGTLGNPERLKPSDLLARADEVLAGFSAPANAALPAAADWLAGITTARNALQEAIAGKRSATSDTTDAVDSLSAIRHRFLNVYNNVAKRLVHAVLAQHGRLDEYRRFFLDLQVNEDGSAASPEPGAPGAPGAPAA